RVLLAKAAPLVQERIQVLGEARGMLAFLFTDDDAIEYEEDALKGLGDDPKAALGASVAALEPLTDWSTAAIEAALRDALVDRLGLKPRLAFGPLRTAVSGRRVSPPL